MQLPHYPNEAMGIILLGEAAAAFDELTRFGGDAFLMQSGEPPWPTTFRAARFIPAVEYLQAGRRTPGPGRPLGSGNVGNEGRLPLPA